MKALSLWQPWATLVAIGAKQFETRSWSTNYRGKIAIHAAKKMTRDQWFYTISEPIGTHFLEAGVSSTNLPRGGYVCIGDLVNIHRTEDIRDTLSGKELALGDYSNNRFAWELSNVQIINPLTERGVRGLWWVAPDIAYLLESRVINHAR